MHPLKKQILEKLILNSSLSFSKLKPENIESNLFIYHLKQLINEGLVQKNLQKNYQLTAEGQVFVDKLKFKTLKSSESPKAIIIAVCKNQEGKYLMYRRMGQPFISKIGFPFLDVRVGEAISRTVVNKYLKHFNLEVKACHRGDVYFTSYLDAKLISYVFCHIFEVTSFKGDLKIDRQIWDAFWGKLEEIDPQELIPGVLEIQQLLAKNPKKHFFQEFVFNL